MQMIELSDHSGRSSFENMSHSFNEFGACKQRALVPFNFLLFVFFWLTP